MLITLFAEEIDPAPALRLYWLQTTYHSSIAHMEYFLMLSHAGVRAGTPSIQAPDFLAGLIYYELKQGDATPSAKVYLPVQRYLANDLEVARGVERLAAGLSHASMAVRPPARLCARRHLHRAEIAQAF
ncbi:hypothetical protein FB451DRAFT_1406302 [Mycena latifolia]|nr:hypothetical protein FB451DRAFT_1406302 [Mycena latifolia]